MCIRDRATTDDHHLPVGKSHAGGYRVGILAAGVAKQDHQRAQDDHLYPMLILLMFRWMPISRLSC